MCQSFNRKSLIHRRKVSLRQMCPCNHQNHHHRVTNVELQSRKQPTHCSNIVVAVPFFYIRNLSSFFVFPITRRVTLEIIDLFCFPFIWVEKRKLFSLCMCQVYIYIRVDWWTLFNKFTWVVCSIPGICVNPFKLTDHITHVNVNVNVIKDHWISAKPMTMSQIENLWPYRMFSINSICNDTMSGFQCTDSSAMWFGSESEFRSI